MIWVISDTSRYGYGQKTHFLRFFEKITNKGGWQMDFFIADSESTCQNTFKGGFLFSVTFGSGCVIPWARCEYEIQIFC